jgi:hypothetical protein
MNSTAFINGTLLSGMLLRLRPEKAGAPSQRPSAERKALRAGWFMSRLKPRPTKQRMALRAGCFSPRAYALGYGLSPLRGFRNASARRK